jgi:signal transduction histidine kinase
MESARRPLTWLTEVDMPEIQSGESWRIVEADALARARLRRQRELLRPLGWAVIAVVAATVFTQAPPPSVDGVGLAVLAALIVFVVATALAIADRFPEWPSTAQAGVIGAMGTSGVIVSVLQPRGASDLAGGAAVWMAVTRLPLAVALGCGVAVTAGQSVAAARTGSPAAVLAPALVSLLLGLVAYLMRQTREGQNRTERLLAQLADAREANLLAAAAAERGRIAAELHDVLAHALSGAAIQLQGARLLAEQERAGPTLAATIDRAGELVADGLVRAREAVSTLRGEQQVTLAELEALINGYRQDMNLDVDLAVHGQARPLPPDAALALFRTAQEALTNAVRHASGARVEVTLRYDLYLTTLRVENSFPSRPLAATPDLSQLGGGHGLVGLRERLEAVGGKLEAGPTGHGWEVEATMPS